MSDMTITQSLAGCDPVVEFPAKRKRQRAFQCALCRVSMTVLGNRLLEFRHAPTCPWEAAVKLVIQ